MVDAGFLDLPRDLTRGLQDSARVVLRLSYDGKEHSVLSTISFSGLPADIQQVLNEISISIDPVNRWACIPGEWSSCSAYEAK